MAREGGLRMIGNRTMVTLINIMNLPKLSFLELSIKTNQSRDAVVEEIHSINEILQLNSLPKIKLYNNHYEVPTELISDEKNIYRIFYSSNIKFEQDERLDIIYLYTFMRNYFISNFHFQELLHVSKNTTLNDLKLLREICSEYSLKFSYSRSEGYHINGSEINKHRMAMNCINNLLHKSIGAWSFQYILEELGEKNVHKQMLKDFEEFAQTNNMSPIENKIAATIYLLQAISVRSNRTKMIIDTESSFKELIMSPLSKLSNLIIDKYFEDNLDSNFEKALQYIEVLLLGSFEGNILYEDSYFRNLTLKIVEEMESVSLIEFDERSELVNGLYKHLVPAFYRLLSGHTDANRNSDMIKVEYRHLFELVQRALTPLQNEFKVKIPDSEISYFVIHFGGYIFREKVVDSSRINALIICPNGVSSSLVIKRQLLNAFPKMNFLETHRSDQVGQINEKEYDLIFSTIPIETTKPLYIVSIFMREHELSELYQVITKQFPTAIKFPSEVEDLVRIIQENAAIKNEHELKKSLNKFLNKEEGGENYPMLSDLITKETFQYSEDKLDWKEAINRAAKPLLDNGAIELKYIDAMIDRVEEYGPFIDLGKGIAIPHARPEDGVNKLSMAMLILENPVYLLDQENHQVNIILVIAAIDNKSHLDALSHLTVLIREDENIQTISNAKSFEEIEKLIESKG